MANHFSAKAKKQITNFVFDNSYVEYCHGVKITHREEKGVSYKTLDKVAFLDWDWPNPSHKAVECVTIQNFGEVVDLMEPWLYKRPEQSIRLYETPGGVRGIFTGTFLTVPELLEMDVESLNSDPLYIKLCKQRNGFGVRISPKLNRTGDYVAKYICTLGVNQDPNILDIVNKFHDNYLL